MQCRDCYLEEKMIFSSLYPVYVNKAEFQQKKREPTLTEITSDFTHLRDSRLFFFSWTITKAAGG